MKILILSSGYPRWKGDTNHTYLHKLSKHLIKKGMEVHVLAPHAYMLKKEEYMDGVYVHRFQYFISKYQNLAYFPGIPEKIKTINGKLLAPFLFFFMGVYLIILNRKYDFDIIYSQWVIPSGVVSFLTKPFHRKPIIVKTYGAEIYPLFKRKTIFSILLYNLVKLTLTNVDAVTSNSGPTAIATKKISGVTPIIIPEGVDLKTFTPNQNVDYIVKKHNLYDSRIIFTTGRMVERKGFEYLIKAMPIVLSEIPNAKLIIGRDGHRRPYLESLSSKLEISDKVIFPGIIDNKDLPKYMAIADVFVLPSIVDQNGDTEGLGLVLLEALASGTPVIGSNVGGIPYIIKNGENGFLVEQKNPEELAKRILELFDEELNYIIGNAGKKYVEDNFTWDVIVDTFIKCLNAVVDA